MPDGWLRESLGDLIVLEYGKGLKEDARDGGQYPVVSSAGVVGHHSHPLVESAPVIVVGRKGSAGTVHSERVKGDETTSHADWMSASRLGSLIHATPGSFGGVGGWWRNRAGFAL